MSQLVNHSIHYTINRNITYTQSVHNTRLALYNKKRIQSFDLFTLSQAPKPLISYANAILPIFRFLNDNMHGRRHKSQNILLWSHSPNVAFDPFLQFILSSAPAYMWPYDNNHKLYVNNVFDFVLCPGFSLVGVDYIFWKLLLCGEQVSLPRKGMAPSVIKQDNPLIIATSKSSLKELVFQKYRYKCYCQLPQNSSILCTGLPKCRVSNMAQVCYSALRHCVEPYEITEPIFPGQTDDVFKLWTDFLLSCVETQGAAAVWGCKSR